MTLDPDFREFFDTLNACKVRYMVVGGYALAHHGAPRYTGDIDVWVDGTASNSERVVEALAAYGFASLSLDPLTFAVPNVVVQLGYPPLRIDIMTTPSGVAFDSCYQHKVSVSSGNVDFDVIGIECFRANKAASGRDKDRADLEALGGETP